MKLRKLIIRQRTRRRGCGFLNTLINKLPVKLHIPSYQYCEPVTRLEKLLFTNDPGINRLDKASKEHDIAYVNMKNLANQILEQT